MARVKLCSSYGGFRKLGGALFGVPIITIELGGLNWGDHIYGNYHMKFYSRHEDIISLHTADKNISDAHVSGVQEIGGSFWGGSFTKE